MDNKYIRYKERKVMKLTYWVCHELHDSRQYSFRAKTKRECVQYLAALGSVGLERRARKSKPCKVVIHYKDAFDLLNKISMEGGNLDEFHSRDDLDDYIQVGRTCVHCGHQDTIRCVGGIPGLYGSAYDFCSACGRPWQSESVNCPEHCGTTI